LAKKGNRHFMKKNKIEIELKLKKALKDGGYLWSYDAEIRHNPSVKENKELLIKCLLHLDYKYINDIFTLFGKSRSKKIWKENLLNQNSRYSIQNFLIANRFFGIKNPDKYIKRYGRN
jgi:hypothetical protein